MPFRIYKDETVVTEGDSPLSITGLNANTDVAEGTYEAVRYKDDKESERVDVPAFKTLPIVPTGVSLNKTSTSILIGAKETLTATVAPADATNKAVTYSSSDTDVATVTNAGVVTAVSVGTATITVKTTSGGKTATCAVTVNPIVPTGVTLSPKTSTAEAGTAGNRQLSATVAPTNATNKNVNYAIAPATTGLAVTNAGNITWTDAVPAGEYTTTVTTASGNRTDTHVLTLTEPEPPEEPDPEEPEE